MKRILLPLLLLIFICAYAQETFKSERVTGHSTHIKGHNIDGVIFDDNYFKNVNDTLERKIKRFTPSIDDILLTEGILKADLKKNLNNANYKYILSHLKEYRRQYMGYYSKDGSRMIYINSFPADLDWADKKIKVES